MNQIRSLSEFTWCPKLPDFILVCNPGQRNLKEVASSALDCLNAFLNINISIVVA